MTEQEARKAMDTVAYLLDQACLSVQAEEMQQLAVIYPKVRRLVECLRWPGLDAAEPAVVYCSLPRTARYKGQD